MNANDVKQLEWSGDITSRDSKSGRSGRTIRERAVHPFGAYFLERDPDDDTWWATDGLLGDDICGPFEEESEAIVAVQDIHTNKVLCCAPPCEGALEVRSFLTLSTSHITEQTRDLLDEEPSRFSGGTYGDYGWFLYCSTENGAEPPIPDDLWAVMQFARGKGCHYILLDRDGDTVDGLPTWEW